MASSAKYSAIRSASRELKASWISSRSSMVTASSSGFSALLASVIIDVSPSRELIRGLVESVCGAVAHVGLRRALQAPAHGGNRIDPHLHGRHGLQRRLP